MALTETDPIDFLLTDGDIVFEKGTFVFSKGVAGAAQSLRFGYQMIKGEWELDKNEGMPWFENDVVAERDAILGQKFDARKTRNALRDVAAKNPLVAGILDLSVEYDNATRKVSGAAQVKTIFGETTDVEVVV